MTNCKLQEVKQTMGKSEHLQYHVEQQGFHALYKVYLPSDIFESKHILITAHHTYSWSSLYAYRLQGHPYLAIINFNF